MKLYEILLHERDGIDRSGEPINVAVPLPAGLVRDVRLLALECLDRLPEPMAALTTAFWPDGSVRWCLLRFRITLAAYSSRPIAVFKRDAPTPNPTGKHVSTENGGQDWWVDTSRLRLSGTNSRLGWRVECDEGNGGRHFVLTPPRLVDAYGNVCDLRLDATDITTDIHGSAATVRQGGYFVTEKGESCCRFESTMELFADSHQLRWQFRLHNPRAAVHSGGLWDLGDGGSFCFESLTLALEQPKDSSVELQLEKNNAWVQVGEKANLFQASSGGEHWDSTNHVDANGCVHIPFRGYHLAATGIELNGYRAEPMLFSSAGVAIFLPHWWQQFPKGVSIEPGLLSLHLFPTMDEKKTYELQGGESKTHTIDFDFGGDRSALMWVRAPMTVPVDPQWLAASGNLLYPEVTEEPLDSLLDIALDRGVGLIAKREIIDEYGWRNFGDLFADHESLYLPKGSHYISHYNNQYDALYGLLRQYLLKGDPQWWKLANELAQHMADIDIYNTTDDRQEYNGGLFWHTDHYVDAHTSTHRTYSRLQRSVAGAAASGGGPGPEHCYSHGLLLHHFLTGSQTSRDAVLSLAQWMTRVYEGNGVLIEQLLRIKSRLLPRIRAASGRAVLNHELPMNRGVGNYINVLLDACLLTGEDRYLLQADSVIRRTVHPYDDIADRNFHDIETTWHYTIFLQAVIRFIELKRQRQEGASAAARYALDCVSHYAQWMAQNEVPYLAKLERLEFPNDTWAAQDIRKAHILYFAAANTVLASEAANFRGSADRIYDYVVTHLQASPTRHYTRILVILMQNHGCRGYYRQRSMSEIYSDRAVEFQYADRPYARRGKLVMQAFGMIGRSLLRFSLRRELDWLRHRNGICAALYQGLYR